VDKAKLMKEAPPAAARAEFIKACSIADHWEFFYERARASMVEKDYASAVEDLDRAIGLRPQQSECLLLRSRALLFLKKYEAAANDFLAAARLDPTESGAVSILDDIVKGLVYQGWEDLKAGRQADAIRIYDLAAELAPSNQEVQGRKVAVMMGGKKPDPGAAVQLEAAVAASPDDLLLRRQLDYAIALTSKDFERIVASWTDYLGRHPDEGRAVLERGGAYFRMGERAEAASDIRRACELGFSEGCGLVERVK
jgi:tetratricopeptide (TPR) repeat protein